MQPLVRQGANQEVRRHGPGFASYEGLVITSSSNWAHFQVLHAVMNKDKGDADK